MLLDCTYLVRMNECSLLPVERRIILTEAAIWAVYLIHFLKFSSPDDTMRNFEIHAYIYKIHCPTIVVYVHEIKKNNQVHNFNEFLF